MRAGRSLDTEYHETQYGCDCGWITKWESGHVVLLRFGRVDMPNLNLTHRYPLHQYHLS